MLRCQPDHRCGFRALCWLVPEVGWRVLTHVGPKNCFYRFCSIGRTLSDKRTQNLPHLVPLGTHALFDRRHPGTTREHPGKLLGFDNTPSLLVLAGSLSRGGERFFRLETRGHCDLSCASRPGRGTYRVRVSRKPASQLGLRRRRPPAID